MRTSLLALLLLVPAAPAAEPNPFANVDPNVFPADDPRAKDLPKMVAADARRRMQEANLRESQAFAAVTTREQWEAHRDARIKALRDSLGTFPEVPKDMRVVVTRKLDGDGYRIENLVYETRPGLWVTANLYLPAKPPAKMPGLLISHSHHTPKTHGELQDMGMTWARAGCAVLVPDHLGHGERKQHDFQAEKDYPKPFRPSRQDYYFRYNSALQLSVVGESLMGWMVWDLMRGIDVLLRQPGIDKDRIILLGAVAGGGDPAGVTAALDPRVSCLVPFNFGGWQPESSATANPDRDFAWFGEGYWETTRGLRGGAAGGFAHYVIVGSIAPRPLIYAHEFKWDPKTDPAWPRLQKIYDFYGAGDRLVVAHGAGSVRGAAGPENTHCTHIGAVHRKMIYPALQKWFGMPIPEEYSQRRPAEDLLCWTGEATAELKPKKLHEVLPELAEARRRKWLADASARARKSRPGGAAVMVELLRADREKWPRLLNDTARTVETHPIRLRSEEVPGGTLTRYATEVEPGIFIPYILIRPVIKEEEPPAVIMYAQAGKAAILKHRGDAIAAFLKAGVVVCLVDVRGTGEAGPADPSGGRTSSRTSISQTNLILGQPLLGRQLGDLRTIIWEAKFRHRLDSHRIALWGDSFVEPNPPDRNPAVPLDAPDLPRVAEPLGDTLTLLLLRFERPDFLFYTRGGLTNDRSLLESPYLYVPHDAVIPGAAVGNYLDPAGLSLLLPFAKRDPDPRRRREAIVDARNLLVSDKPAPPAEVATWIAGRLTGK